MKTILFALLLIGLTVGAQTPEAPGMSGAPGAGNGPGIPSPTPVDRAELARRAAARRAATNNPANPASAFPAFPVPGGRVSPAGAGDQNTIVNPPGAAVPSQDVAGAVAPGAPGNAPVPEGEEMISASYINWTAAELPQVLSYYGELVHRTILRSPGVVAGGTYALKAHTDLTRKEAIQAIEAILAMNNIATINFGDKFVKVVPVGTVATAGAPASTNSSSTELSDLGGYTTHMVSLKYVKPSDMAEVLKNFANVPTSILPLDGSMMLVLRDYTENVKRMLEIVERLDVYYPSEFESQVIPIKYALATDIASALNSLSGSGGGSTVGSRSTGRTGSTGSPGGLNRGANGLQGQPGYNGVNPTGGVSPGSVGTTAGNPSSTASFAGRLNDIIRRASSATGDLTILGTTKIIADERTNSLLIFAGHDDMKTITNIVGQLDVVLAQVLIETIIMDVSMDNGFNFGVSAAQDPKNLSKNAVTAGGYNNGTGFFNFLNTAATNGFASTLPNGASYFGKFGQSWEVAVTAAESDSRINVIQKPRVQTSHATPAHIFIGSTVPYVSSTYYGGGFGGGPSSSYQQLRVGIDLSVTPFINPDGLVVMKIQEAIDELAGSTAIAGVGDVPNTTSRQLEAEVAVRDGETIILGGFIRNSETKKRSGVPLLRDIPLLGNLFSQKSSAKERKELIVLMRPTVLRTPELAALQVVEEKKRLSGVSEAEASIGADERKQREETQRKLFKGTHPFTPEEEKQLNGPTPIPPPTTPSRNGY